VGIKDEASEEEGLKPERKEQKKEKREGGEREGSQLMTKSIK